MPDDGSFLTQAAFRLGEPSLQDLIDRIEADAALPAAKRTHWLCSLRRVAAFLERNPSNLPARMRALRQGLSRLHHAQLGISRKSLQNHLSNLKAALAYGQDHVRPGRGAPLSPAWVPVMEQADERSRRGLSSFARYCSTHEISSGAVSDSVIEAFLAWRAEVSFVQDAKALHKQVARAWNGLAVADPALALRPVALPDFRPKRRSLPWSDFPDGFQRDVEAYLAWLGGTSLDDEGPAHTCKQSTVTTRRRMLLLAASAAVRAGIPASQHQSLADLVVPATAKAVLEQYLIENQGKVSTFIADLAGMLFGIAHAWCRMPDAELDKLRRFRRRLDGERRKGLTDKNMAVVRRVLDGRTWARVQSLPQRLMDQALAEEQALHKAAVLAQIAVAIQILIVAPLRVGNLCALSFDDNLVRPAGPDGPLHIVISDYDVKNRVPLEYPLPAAVTRLIDLYLTRFRHRLKGSNGPWLFPGENGGHKAQRTLSEQITERIWREVGFKVTPHQFRHAAAAVILQHEPGNYELVRRVLGHKNIQTTINAYVGLESLEAARHFSLIALGGNDEEDER